LARGGEGLPCVPVTSSGSSGAANGRAGKLFQVRAPYRVGADPDDEMLTPPRAPPPPFNTAADTAHSAHSTQSALRPHRATLRVEDKPPQTRRPHSIGLCSPLSEGPDPGTAQRHVNAGSPFYRFARVITQVGAPCQVGLYKIFVDFESVVHESTILTFRPPARIAIPGAMLLHAYWTVFGPPFDFPFVCYTPYTINNNDIV